jgi:hypothetical protein
MLETGINLHCLRQLDAFMAWIGLIAVLLASALSVRVTPTAGDAYDAQWIGLKDQSLRLTVDGVERSVPVADIRRVDRTESKNRPSPTISVGLQGGSRLKVESLGIEKETATLRLRGQDPLVVPLRQLDWIRFRAPSPAVDPDWLGLVGQRQADDILVIRRSATAIDRAPGIVLAADAEKVEFELGGSVVPAPVAKLEGIVFAGRDSKSDSSLLLVDTSGSQWALREISESDDPKRLTMIMADSKRRDIDLEMIESLRFADSAAWLADLQPVSSDYVPLVKSGIENSLLNSWLGPQRSGERDWVLRSRSSVTFRVEPGFDSFVALVKPDPSVVAGAGAIVRVRLDDEEAWQQMILPGDEPKGLELNISAASRVTLEVDFGEDGARGDAGDVIRFIDPRFVK